ncbi:hypothetical protein GGX14DRAFT_397785 [Mycena pura]|uniref:Uncharacterized protein n=1 Tax=Mycena pura TaxID=153505 RepID=A0AAD6V7L1_9AGAR|nr:hypothetical protein GGX14DRAFT_397785 [Mycena pura]
MLAERFRRIKLPKGDRLRKVPFVCNVTPQMALRIERNTTVSKGIFYLALCAQERIAFGNCNDHVTGCAINLQMCNVTALQHSRTPVYPYRGRILKTGLGRILSGFFRPKVDFFLSGFGSDLEKIPIFCPDSVSTSKNREKCPEIRENLLKSVQQGLIIVSVILLEIQRISLPLHHYARRSRSYSRLNAGRLGGARAHTVNCFQLVVIDEVDGIFVEVIFVGGEKIRPVGAKANFCPDFGSTSVGKSKNVVRIWYPTSIGINGGPNTAKEEPSQPSTNMHVLDGKRRASDWRGARITIAACWPFMSY